MNDRFKITEIRVCPFEIINDKLSPNLNYPFRKCVIDMEKNIAVDIELNIQYDYLPTMSDLYFLSSCRDKVKDNRRVAVFPVASILFDEKVFISASQIIKKLMNNEELIDGNEYLCNEAYLEIVSKKEEPKKKKFCLFNKKLK